VRRVGVVGLGVGTLATYGRRGDSFSFIEINPAVIEIASQYFYFLDQSEARTEVVAGDGRLALGREPSGSFNVLVLDAFADDSIPVHLMTKEAFELYFRLLRSDGVLAIHLTNRYVDLAPVVEGLTAALHKDVAIVRSPGHPDEQILAADWAIVPVRTGGLSRFGMVASRGVPTRLWTDDYSNLFQVLK
jgi:spermidine synthase